MIIIKVQVSLKKEFMLQFGQKLWPMIDLKNHTFVFSQFLHEWMEFFRIYMAHDYYLYGT